MTSKVVQKNKRSVSPMPAYQRIEEDIRRKVRDGQLPAGTMLASRHNLAKEYGVSLSTVQQSVANLAREGTLEVYDRRGTFVAPTHRSQENGAASKPSFADAAENRAVVDAGPPASAWNPVGRTTATLGIVSTSCIDPEGSMDVDSLWTRLAIRSLEYVFSAAGGTIHYFDRYPGHRGPYTSDPDDPNAIPLAEAVGSLCSGGVDALAIIGLCDTRDRSDTIIAAVDVERVPTVYLSWHEAKPPLSQVLYDNRFAGYQAAQHLLRKGYRHLLFFTPFTQSWLVERIEGARDAIRHARLSPDSLKIYPAEPTESTYDIERVEAATYQAAQQVFAGDWVFSNSEAAEPWGFIAPNDNTAYVIQRAATEFGKTVGVDYGLVGFDDGFRSSSVGLTTVRPPVEAMGEEAGRMLLRALQGKNSGLQVRLRSQVIPRSSTSLRSRTASKNGR